MLLWNSTEICISASRNDVITTNKHQVGTKDCTPNSYRKAYNQKQRKLIYKGDLREQRWCKTQYCNTRYLAQ